MSEAAPAAFPWEEAMAFCLGRLRWTPRDFWNATPRELAAALDGSGAASRAQAPTRAVLAALMARFPD
ncbi:MAG: phage tail assembly chaperone [Salinarimonadaceae bacterium]|nr:MAG: phage tail assembly chaperone [Salinarimonadaceae bacterium]